MLQMNFLSWNIITSVPGKFSFITKRKFKTVIVNNAININKTNNHLSHQIIEHKNTMTYDVGNQGPGLRQEQKCGRVKSINGIPPSPLDNSYYFDQRTKVFTYLYTYIDKGIYLSVHLYWQRYLSICTPILTKVFTCLYTYIDKGIYLSVHLYWQRYLPVCTPILTSGGIYTFTPVRTTIIPFLSHRICLAFVYTQTCRRKAISFC
jgi:hypothetical protein